MHDAKLQTTQNGKISCPTCKKILKFSEQMNADHETVCMFCGTVLYEQIESVSSSENVSESSANLSINLVGDYQKLLPSKMKSNFSSLKRFYINRPELSTFSTICQWLTYASTVLVLPKSFSLTHPPVVVHQPRMSLRLLFLLRVLVSSCFLIQDLLSASFFECLRNDLILKQDTALASGLFLVHVQDGSSV